MVGASIRLVSIQGMVSRILLSVRGLAGHRESLDLQDLAGKRGISGQGEAACCPAAAPQHDQYLKKLPSYGFLL